jgi:hypothetical protein
MPGCSWYIQAHTRPTIPLMLFDLHNSRRQVPFLQYVNDEQHKWKACIGLPNGTGKWQLRDSSEQNGQ